MPRNGALDRVGASFFVLSEGRGGSEKFGGDFKGAFSERGLRGRCSAAYGGVRGRVHAVFVCLCGMRARTGAMGKSGLE